MSRSRCVDPPRPPGRIPTTVELQNWALASITKIKRTREQEVTTDDLAILLAGRYEDARRKMVVTFSLPVTLTGEEENVAEVPVS